MRHGDFTELAKNYALWRPRYAPMVLDAFCGLVDKPGAVVADIGAGTGIWSRMLAGTEVKKIICGKAWFSAHARRLERRA